MEKIIIPVRQDFYSEPILKAMEISTPGIAVECEVEKTPNRPNRKRVFLKIGEQAIMAIAIILIGVSGCGKSSVGNGLADKLNWPFYDGDDYHPQSNIDKMAQGLPLNDSDRQPWLERLHDLIAEHLNEKKSLIMACSALKSKYRQTLAGGRSNVKFVYLAGSFDLIYRRMQKRRKHYMKAEMLHSQFADLELPQNALTVLVDQPVDAIVAEIIENLQPFCKS